MLIRLVLLLLLVLVTPVFATGKKGQVRTEVGEKPLKVALIIPGVLGDQSFFDSADRGIKQAQEKYGSKIETRVVEGGIDETKWLPTLYDYAGDGSWDIIITGTWSMLEQLAEVATRYPQQKFFFFDETMDYQGGKFPHIYSILYRQNEAAFLVGAIAAKVNFPPASSRPKQRVLGFVGGMSSPVIHDFLVGYIQGAKYVEPSTKVVVSYVGNFHDSPKAKDLALAQYTNKGVEVVFNVAGLAGLGVIDAAVEQKKYAIGVNSDQAAILGPPAAQHILTSALKNVDYSLVRALDLHLQGKLPYGSSETLGLDMGGVALAQNSYYESLVSQEVRDQIAQLTKQIQAGEIKVATAMGEGADVRQIIESAR